MSSKDINNNHLRRKAEKLLKNKQHYKASEYANDLESLVEELNIYHIELEHQNEALRVSQQEEEKAKERYLSLFNEAPVGYLLMQKDAKIIDINNTACELLKRKKEDIIRLPFVTYIHELFQDTFYFHIKSVIKNKTLQECDIKIKLPGGQTNFLRLFSLLENNTEKQETIRTTIVNIDIQKELEKNLLIEKERAQESDKLKSAFLANMSHEIRTPMNSILGFSSLIVDKDLSKEQQRTFLNTINESGSYLLKLINDILDISKIDASQLKVHKTDCNILDICSYCYNVISNDRQFKLKPEVELKLRVIDKNKGIVVKTDGERLKQVVINLLNNALKFTKQGVIEYGFNIKTYNDNKFIEFYVKDTGVGIPADKLLIVFERFRQVNMNDAHHGTGLGLSICKGIVELLGGEIHVSSRVGQGSIFTFTIPYENGESQHKNINTVKHVDLSGKLVLIAEDDPASYVYLAELLKTYNCNIHHIAEGNLIVDYVNEHNPDIILLDINLPGKSGLEVLKELRFNNNTSKVIVQTAYAMGDEKRKFLNAGADAYLSKPIKRMDLEIALKSIEVHSENYAASRCFKGLD